MKTLQSIAKVEFDDKDERDHFMLVIGELKLKNETLQKMIINEGEDSCEFILKDENPKFVQSRFLGLLQDIRLILDAYAVAK